MDAAAGVGWPLCFPTSCGGRLPATESRARIRAIPAAFRRADRSALDSRCHSRVATRVPRHRVLATSGLNTAVYRPGGTASHEVTLVSQKVPFGQLNPA